MANRKAQKMFELVEGIGTAMLTTRRRDGHLVSRPMAAQARARGADFWFATALDSAKVREIQKDRHVNLTYYRDRTREWVSVSGVAEIVTDRRKVRELYRPDWRAWFGDEGGAKDGGPDDPRIGLIAVRAEEAHFLVESRPEPVVLFEVMKGMVTGKPPKAGRVAVVKGAELSRRGEKARPAPANERRTASAAKTTASRGTRRRSDRTS